MYAVFRHGWVISPGFVNSNEFERMQTFEQMDASHITIRKRISKGVVDPYLTGNRKSIAKVLDRDRKKDLLKELEKWVEYAHTLPEHEQLYSPVLSIKDSLETILNERNRVARILDIAVSEDEASDGESDGSSDSEFKPKTKKDKKKKKNGGSAQNIDIQGASGSGDAGGGASFASSSSSSASAAPASGEEAVGLDDSDASNSDNSAEGSDSDSESSDESCDDSSEDSDEDEDSDDSDDSDDDDEEDESSDDGSDLSDFIEDDDDEVWGNKKKNKSYKKRKTE